MTWATGTGGNVVEDITDGEGVTWRYHRFTTVGAGTFTATTAGDVEYLIVAGGGGGGGIFTTSGAADVGGGGGAGGVLFGKTSITPQAYTISVGGGGAAGAQAGGTNGANSSAFSFTAIGGGGGGGASTAARPGKAGGSGGGAFSASVLGGAGTAGQGFDGGRASGNSNAGGGGGANDFGKRAITARSISGNGGDGIEWPAGSGEFYGGGGGGGARSGRPDSGDGGLGGGGKGALRGAFAATAGAPNTGGGGGGGAFGTSQPSAAGGSGIVVVRYPIDGTPTPPAPTAIQATGGTVTDVVEDGVTWRYHTFLRDRWAFRVTAAPAGANEIEYLLVGGGGSGGTSGSAQNAAGGGGAGGVLFGTTTVSVQDYEFVPGANAENTVALGLTALAGGRGGNGGTSAAAGLGLPGGSGGGNGGGTLGGSPAGAGTPGQGFEGGRGENTTAIAGGGGGGGGARDVGKRGLNYNSIGRGHGDGGNGVEWPNGSGNYYGGGGGGGTGSSTGVPGVGGVGGGGTGARGETSGAPATSGIDGTGGGGGGGARVQSAGRGGDGTVIVRYPIEGTPQPIPTPRGVRAEGGEVFDEQEGDVTWRYHKFQKLEKAILTVRSAFPGENEVEYLIVSGGGSGGNNSGGGGGAGGVLFGTTTVSAQAYEITIGQNGQTSSAFGLTPLAGGNGGPGNAVEPGSSGGSGGGSGRSNALAGTGEAGPPRQGHDGGVGRTTSENEAGGGGGASAAGQNGSSSKAGDGGAGLEWPAGSGEFYAGGGGGGSRLVKTAEGAGGVGGGGRGAMGASISTGFQRSGAGRDGTGGGGGGGGSLGNTGGSRGGRGVVLVRYPLITGPSLATVTTGTATNVTKTSATINGTLDNDGGDPNGASVGLVAATTPNDDDVFFLSGTLGTTPGAYSAEVTGLTAGTEYFFKIFAINSEGVANGDWVSFTTDLGDPPTVLNAGVDFLGTFAEFAGLIIDEGEGPVTGRGFVYGPNANPVIGQSGVVNVPAGSGIGGFSARATGLTPETTYNWRAYATNAQAGTGYADSESFTTTPAEAPQFLSLTMPTVDEDTIPSTGTARFQNDPEDTGTYTWQVSAQLTAPYTGASSAALVGNGAPAGTVAVIAQSDPDKRATIRFTPNADWFGEVTFSYRVGNGAAFSDWEQATVTVRPVPDPPGPVIGQFPIFDEDTTATFDLTWTDPDDLPPGTLVAADGYFLQMRPTAGGPWRWLTEGSPTARLTNVTVRVLNYSDSELRGTFRVEPDANYYGPYGAQVRVAKQLEDESYLFGPVRNLAGTIAPVPDAPTRPQPNRIPTAKIGQTVDGRFTTFDPDIEDTSWVFEISAPGADDWGSSLVIPDVGTLTVVDDDITDQETLVRLVQEEGGATDLRYEFDLRVTDSSGLISPVQRVVGLITLPTATVFLQKVTRSSPAVVTPLTPLVEVFDLNVTDSIDGIGGADVTVSTDEVRRRAAQLGITAAELLEPGTVELVVAIGTQLVFVGPVGEVEWSATRDRITIEARGLLSYLEERRIGSGTTSFVGEDISDIMWSLVEDAQSQSFGDYAFTDNTTTAGTNLTVEFEPRTRILEALRRLARADGGPDFWIDPERRLNTATARGQDRSDIIRLTPGMMEGATWTNRDEQLATVVTVIGGEDGMGGFFQGTAVTTDTAALAKYGRREKLIERSELTSDQQCEDYAARIVEEQARRSETIRLDIVVTPGRPFSIRDLEVGDILTVDLRAPDLGQVIGAYRVVNRRLNLVSETADSYRVRLDLVPAPFINSELVKVKARHNASIVERLAQLNSQQE